MAQRANTAMPSTWSNFGSLANSTHAHLEVEGERVKYIGPGCTDKDAASVRANHAVPLGVSLYYFEIEVLNRGRNGFVGIGFSAPTVDLHRLPGWEGHSYGYHGDDGHAFHHCGRGRDYGPKFGKGDVIGAVLNRVDKTVSFTKNGENLGVAFHDVEEEHLHPTVVANFGSRPFKADVSQMQADLAASVMQDIDSRNPLHIVESCHRPSMEAIVMEYLSEKGYWRTAQAAAQPPDTAFEDLSEKDLQDMQRRQQVQEAIICGRNQDALMLVAEISPGFLSTHQEIHFRLERMVFMELVESRMTTEAIAFGKKVLAPMAQDGPLRYLLHEALTLLTVTNVKECPSYQALLGKEARMKLAADVNSALLKFVIRLTPLGKQIMLSWRIRNFFKPGMSLLERSIRHLDPVRKELTKAGNPAVGLVDFGEYLGYKSKTS